MPGITQLVESFRCSWYRSVANIQHSESVKNKSVHFTRYIQKRIRRLRFGAKVGNRKAVTNRLIPFKDAVDVIHASGGAHLVCVTRLGIA